MDLLQGLSHSAISIDFCCGRPRDVDGPSLAAEALGQLLVQGGSDGRAHRCSVFAGALSEGLSRLWPMVEALAGRPVDVRFTAEAASAGIVVDAVVGSDSARAVARQAGADDGLGELCRLDQTEPAADAPPDVGGLDMPAWWVREEGHLLGLRGARCGSCGRVEFPRPPARCPGCRADMVTAIVSTRGRLLTWTVDRLYEPGVDTGMAVVDLAGGGRFYGQVADGTPLDRLVGGLEVRLVPRVLHRSAHRTAYFWKVTTVGEAQSE